MGIFSKTATVPDEATLQKSIASERILRDQTEARLTAARKTKAEHTNALEKARKALADDKTLDVLGQKEIIAERHVTGFESDLVESAARLTDLEKKLADHLDQRQREKAAFEDNALEIRFVEAASNHDKTGKALIACCEEVNLRLPYELGLAKLPHVDAR
jgi:predicted  nucleic acid-binding Zn-ribbon protein